MKRYNGHVAFNGYSISNAVLYNPCTLESKHEFSSVEEEFNRFLKARTKAINDLENLYEDTLKRIGEDEAILFQTHKLMAEDLDFEDAIKALIAENKIAEDAVIEASEQLSLMFSSMDDEYMKARAADVKEVGVLISDIISGKNKAFELKKDSIVIANDLPSSALMKYDAKLLKGLILIKGNINSHVAILARALEIPSIVAVSDMSLEDVNNGDTVIVDAIKGKVIINPDFMLITDYKKIIQKYDEDMSILRQYIGKPTITKDGYKMKIYSNITGVLEVDNVLKNDSEGVGLFRSEFIYLNSKNYPTEAEQFKYYKDVVSKMNGKEVIIRTLDIGADKKVDYFDLPEEENPALGYRSIRICKDRPEIFLTQLKALYRASHYGNLAIMIPMITSLLEVMYARKMCMKAQQELTKEGLPYNPKVKIGIMIETPAAALMSDELAKYVDFFSIGTNDLSQYTLACDRLNPMLNNTFNAYHPAILRLIKITVENAHKAGITCGMCGELAHDAYVLPFLVGLHIDELSCSSAYCLQVRKSIGEIDSSKVDMKKYIGD